MTGMPTPGEAAPEPTVESVVRFGDRPAGASPIRATATQIPSGCDPVGRDRRQA
jgi:hypothetical protein